MHVVDGELGERDAVVDQGLLERAGRRVAVRLQQQLDAVRVGGGDDGKPAASPTVSSVLVMNPSLSV